MILNYIKLKDHQSNSLTVSDMRASFIGQEIEIGVEESEQANELTEIQPELLESSREVNASIIGFSCEGVGIFKFSQSITRSEKAGLALGSRC